MNLFLINGHQRYEGFAAGRLNQTIIDATEKQLTAAGHEVKTSIWNTPLESFEDPAQFFEGRGVDGAFMWLHKVYQFFGMEQLPT